MPEPAMPSDISSVPSLSAADGLGEMAVEDAAGLCCVSDHGRTGIGRGGTLDGLLAADDVERVLPVIPVPAFVFAGDSAGVAVLNQLPDKAADRHRGLFTGLVNAEELAVHVADPGHD